MSFLKSLLNNSKKFDDPFTHWELNQPLTKIAVQEISNADIINPIDHNLQYDGTRAIDGGEGEYREGISSGGRALKFRCFINKENAKNFPYLTKLIKELQSKETTQKISEMINKDLSNSFVRLEIICDIVAPLVRASIFFVLSRCSFCHLTLSAVLTISAVQCM